MMCLRGRGSGGATLLIALAICATCSLTETLHAQDRQLSEPVRAKLDELISDIIEPSAELKIQLRRSKLVQTKKPIQRAAVADPDVVELVAFGTQEIELIGKKSGSTTLTLWMGDAEQPPERRIRSSSLPVAAS